MAASIKVPTVFTAEDKFSSVVNRMTKNVRSFSRKSGHYINRFDQKVNSVFSGLRNTLGTFGLYVGGAAIVGALGSAMNVTMQYEQANANLASVLGVNISQTQSLQKESSRLGATTSFTAAEVVGLQTEYAKLGFAEAEILKVADGTLALAAATKTELPQAAAQVGAVIRAFSYEASEAGRVADVFAASTSKSALNMEYLNTAMATVAPVASKFGFGVEDVTALLGNLADSGFDASSAATATRNILLNLADSNGKLAKSLGRPVKSLPDLVSGLNELNDRGIDLAGALELTDKRSVAAFSTFLSGTGNITKLSKALGDAGGTAEKMADKQLNTLSGRLTILNSAYEGFILSMDKGDGTFSKTAKNVVDVVTEMLSLASGTAKATEDLTKGEEKLRFYAEAGIFAVKIIAGLIGALLAFKTVMFIVTTATALYTKAQWAVNAAMNANPIGLVVVLITALVAIVAKAIEYYDSWGASLLLMMGPLGMIVNLVMGFKKHWDKIVSTFKEDGIVAGFKMIGRVIMDSLLYPMEQFLGLLGKIPGVGKFIDPALEFVKNARANIGLDDETSDPEVVPGPEERTNRMIQENYSRGSLAINLNDPGGYVDNVEQSGNLEMPIIGPTQGSR